MAVAIFGISVIVVSRLFGPENPEGDRPELLASFGSTILLFAIFGFFFRTGIQRLLRWVPGGETLEESAERLRELLQDFDVRGREPEGSPDGESWTGSKKGSGPCPQRKYPAWRTRYRNCGRCWQTPHTGGRSDLRVRPSLTFRGVSLPAASVLLHLFTANRAGALGSPGTIHRSG